MNENFQATLKRENINTPPIWFMRQAGRYHSHYQNLRKNHGFLDLCRKPELAAQVALGPIMDFDFDVSILFSDILFPLDALGLGLSYSDTKGPALQKKISSETLLQMPSPELAIRELYFQGEALKQTRSVLPKNKSLIGFVGGPWTLFVYGIEGGHSGNLIEAKTQFSLYHQFMEVLYPLMKLNIANQLQSGAEVVMIFDTAGGECSPEFFKIHLEPYLLRFANEFPGKLGYYTKFASPEYFSPEFNSAPWAGRGYDHRHNMPRLIKISSRGFVQGNFDQALLFLPHGEFKKAFELYIRELSSHTYEQRCGLVLGLGHGVLPKTPEENVRYFVQRAREVLR